MSSKLPASSQVGSLLTRIFSCWGQRRKSLAITSIDPDAVKLLCAYRYSPESQTWKDATQHNTQTRSLVIKSFQILSWNVEFTAPMVAERLQCALSHIQHDVLHCADDEHEPTPCCILLQDIDKSAIDVILRTAWVQKHFLVTPISDTDWPNGATYGNVTIVSTSLPLLRVWSLVFRNSLMNRNALMVDLAFDQHDKQVLRVGNTHLESLPGLGTTVRPLQLGLIAKALTDANMLGGLVGGDMNAIRESDLKTPREVGLVDAFQGSEEDAAGFTWGYQPACQYPPGRLDKFLYTASAAFIVYGLERFGVDAVVRPEGPWISDHYGLIVTVALNTRDVVAHAGGHGDRV